MKMPTAALFLFPPPAPRSRRLILRLLQYKSSFCPGPRATRSAHLAGAHYSIVGFQYQRPKGVSGNNLFVVPYSGWFTWLLYQFCVGEHEDVYWYIGLRRHDLSFRNQEVGSWKLEVGFSQLCNRSSLPYPMSPRSKPGKNSPFGFAT